MAAQSREQRDLLQKQNADGAAPSPPVADGEYVMGSAQLDQMIQVYEQAAQQAASKSVEQAADEIAARGLGVNAVSTSGADVFVACYGTEGYGFSIWRTDAEFQNPVEVVKDLRGCCGQMDVQCRGDELFVAENARHRVAVFDRDGQEKQEFGERDRDGAGAGFSGCCNPMNTCFGAGGEIYVAESNGVVKLFTAAGEYDRLVGLAEVQPGCKNSAIAVTPDASRVYYVDVQRAKILVLKRTAAATTSAGG